MAALLRIDDLSEPPVIGSRYLVPMVYAYWYGKREWWPVIGPKHEDADVIGFPWLHYHVDPRFLPRRTPEFVLARTYRSPMVEATNNPSLAAPIYRRRLLCREFPEYPDSAARIGRGFLGRLEAHHVSDRLRKTDRGWVCPHRGLLLASCPVDADGTIRCPLHGLRWHASTGLPAFAILRKVS